MGAGRPRNEIPRNEKLTLRLTKFELEKISKIAEKKNISRTEAILQGIDLLIAHKPKKYRTIPNAPKHSIGTSESEITPYIPKK